MNLLMKLIPKIHAWIYRSSGGKRGAHMNGQQIVLLTTKGRKTGQQRTVPVMGFADGANWVVVASKAGAPEHPAWFLNLEAEPDVGLQVGPQVHRARASVLESPARDEWWQRIITNAPQFAGYEKKTSRKIPLVRLTVQ